ncbi:MAG: ABC transporter permease [Candidatus Dormibacteraeota bacterium]|nr:ABC transporter permease [Candidatus Dormibacteraeota bacterium]
MSFRRVVAIIVRLSAGFRRDRRTLALMFVVPLIVLGLFWFLFRGGGQQPAMGIVNQDQGAEGAAVAAQLLRSGQVEASQMDATTAARRLRDGSLAGYVVLPADFSQSLVARSPDLRVHLEGSQPSSSSAVVGASQAALMAAMGVQARPQVSYLHGGPNLDTLDYFGGAFIGLVIFFLVFVLTSVAFLRERSTGTLERLMASPLRRGEVVIGYMLGFALLAVLQSAEVLAFSLWVLHVHNQGSVGLIFAVEVLMALAAVNLGIFLSMFARTEFQAVQFIPLVILPQVLLSGIIFPVSTEPGWLQGLSNVLPLTYAVNALRDVMLKGADLTWPSVQLDLGVVLAFAVAMVFAAMATLRRQVA